MDKNQALKLALEALEEPREHIAKHRRLEAITAIHKVLAQPEQKPVPWATREDYYRELNRSVERIRKEMEIKSVTMRCKDYDLALPIINTHFGRVLVGQGFAPPQRKPLTDEEIAKAWAQSKGDILMRLKPFARAIEAAHGIKGE